MPLFNYTGNPYARHHLRPLTPTGVQGSSQIALAGSQPQQSFQIGMASQPLQRSSQTGMANNQLSMQQMAPMFDPLQSGGMQNLFGMGGIGMTDPTALLLHLLSQNPYGDRYTR